MARLAGRLLLFAAGAAAAWWAWTKVQEAEQANRPGPDPQPEPRPQPEPAADPVQATEPVQAADDPGPGEVPTEAEADPADADNRAPEPMEAEADNRPAIPESPPATTPVVVNGVEIPAPDALIHWVNQAEEAALEAAGIGAAARKTVLAHRPFGSVDSLGNTRGIGPKTLEALAHASSALE